MAVQLARGGYQSDRKNAIILAFRGTEFDDDFFNDVRANAAALTTGKYTSQSNEAYKAYKDLVKKYPDNDIYLAGHSLGGKITQDVLMEIYEENDGKHSPKIKEPYKSATFNGYGYRKGNNHLKGNNFIQQNKLNKMIEYYKYGRIYNYTMKGDVVGEKLAPIKLGQNMPSFTAHDESSFIIDLSKESVPYYGKGTSVDLVHGIKLFHINNHCIYKGKDSKINIYELQFIGK